MLHDHVCIFVLLCAYDIQGVIRGRGYCVRVECLRCEVFLMSVQARCMYMSFKSTSLGKKKADILIVIYFQYYHDSFLCRIVEVCGASVGYVWYMCMLQ